MDFIYHSAMPQQWEAARSHGVYRQSTRDVTLEQEGFIHCSHVYQLERTLNTYYSDVEEILLLEIDVSLLESEVIEESAPGAGQTFPHIYGPVPVAAVVRAVPWRIGSDGTFCLDDVDL
ncbi:MAG: DUF952 domain-containing protein [Acidimicrobiales bacterium]